MPSQFSITTVLESLKRKRTIFSLEADFQFALAWEIKELYPEAEMRLEWIPPTRPNTYIDIVVFIDNKFIPIELKYTTKKADVTVGSERFVLKSQGAKDLRAYAFLKDVSRIEQLKQDYPDTFATGYAVMLTNDPSSFATPKETANYSNFSLASGSTKGGVIGWLDSTKPSANGLPALNLTGKYPIEWERYSQVGSETVSQLVIAIR